MNSKVAVVILNWNGLALLQKFLPSVVKFSGEAEVYVADNASTDDSILFVTQQYPTVKIIQNKRNGGYAGGYNDALQNIEADYFVLLNSDVEVSENWIAPIQQLMDSQPGIAACQPKLLSYTIDQI